MKKLGVFLIIILFVGLGSSAHYLSGWTKDALDGTSVDGKMITLWSPSVGINDNITDKIGILGNSGVSHTYLLDCEMLNGGCVVGQILSLKIFGERYISRIFNISVSGAGYDVVENITLNSPPTAHLIFPNNGGNFSSNINFNCSYRDHDSNLVRVALWGNWMGGWGEIESRNIGPNGGSEIFSKTLGEGHWKWNCLVEDDLEIWDFAYTNYSFFVDNRTPIINYVTSGVTSVCGFGNIWVNCSAYDENLTIDSVIIQSISPNNSLLNYSASFISDSVYGASVNIGEIGDWRFRCFVNDSVGNTNDSFSDFVMVESGRAELSIVGGNVFFDKSPDVEGELINISVNISNSGCGNSGNFVVGFFDNDGNFENKSVFIGTRDFLNVSSLWETKIGLSNISVYVDFGNVILEDNESNNVAKDSIYLKAWQNIYGNVSLDKVLGFKKNNMSFWSGESSFAGNIFVADSEAELDWNNLQAFGRTKLGGNSFDDFGEIDSVLGMNFFNDSIENIYNDSEVGNFRVFQRDIENVPFVNSSDSGNFVTGILWDMSDSGNSEYDSTEKEDVVFIARINQNRAGSWGIYDYEISVPSKLREYRDGDTSKVYLYYDLN